MCIALWIQLGYEKPYTADDDVERIVYLSCGFASKDSLSQFNRPGM